MVTLADLSYYLERVLNILPKREDRPFLNFAVRKAEEERILFIEAPTGYGKSVISQTIALRSLKEGLKCIVAFPLRTLLEDQLNKFRLMAKMSGFDREEVGARYMHYPESRYLIKPVTLTTIDTLSLTLFGLAPEDLEVVIQQDGTLTGSLGHYLFSRAMVLLSDLILDEVHLLSDTTKSLNFLVALIRIIASHGGRAVFMSATIPKALENVIKTECAVVRPRFTRFSEKPDERFLEERRRKKYEKMVIEEVGKSDHEKFEKILGWIKEGRRDGYKRSLVVFNTVHEAIEFYEKAKANLDIPHDKILLLHSRFAVQDRETKITKINALKESSEYLIISTQVIEAGVDISSNIFISDLAPASTLIQRLGRFLRYPGENEGRLYLWYEKWEEDKRYKGVYDSELLEKTLNFLSAKDVRFHDPESYQPLLDNVYDDTTFCLNRNDIMKLISITNILECPREAVRIFIGLEGSFVRDETIVPVLPSSLKYEEMSPTELEKQVIPLNLSLLYRLKPKERLLIKDEKPIKEQVGKYWEMRVENLLKHIFEPEFLAFIVEGEYDKELGLVIKYEQNYQLQER